jgi:hypothetical protein
VQVKERASLLNTIISRSISQTASPSPPPSISSPNATSQKGITTIDTDVNKKKRKFRKE